MSFLFIFFQYIIPQHLLSRLGGKIATSSNVKIKNALISYFLKNYDINMEEAEVENAFDFKTFNHFFTRKLKEKVRPISSESNVIISPADGVVSQIGFIKNGKVFQAKGRSFSLHDFLGRDKNLSETFIDGSFSTIYLSPKDYHRIHMPLSGTLRRMNYIPGNLFSVNPVTVESIDNLFARNERLSCIFETKNGPMAIVLVGAMIVAGIRVIWEKNPFVKNRKIQQFEYPSKGQGAVYLKKGDELGRFLLGSTVVICFPKNTIVWNEDVQPNAPLKMGESIAMLIR